MDSTGQIRASMEKRLTLLLDLTVLEALCSADAVDRLRGESTALRGGHLKSLLLGYRLAIATPLYGMVEGVVDNPPMLGFEFDDGLYDFLHYSHNNKPASLSSAVSDPGSDLARLCHVFDDLHHSLRTTAPTLDDTVTVIQLCSSFAARLREIMTETRVVSLATGEEISNGASIFRGCLAHRILDYVYYGASMLFRAYEMVWKGEAEYQPADDLFVRIAETHLDDVALFPPNRIVPIAWMDGTVLGFRIVNQVNELGFPQTDSERVDKETWYEGIRAFGDRARHEDDWPREKIGLTEFSLPHIQSMLEQIDEDTDHVSSSQRLTAILGPDTVHLMTSTESTAPLELEVMLRGAVMGRGDSKVRLLLLAHSVASDDREWVSVAFRLPVYGAFSNASKWFLFYKMYHTGYVFDTDVARATTAVERLLSEFKGNLEVEELSGLDSEDFLPLCVPPAFRAMRALSLGAVETNAELRSGNSELLAAFWLVGQGYDNVKVSLRHAALGEFEYDAIGVKNGECLVLEVKGSEISDHELEEQIRRFADKIDRLRGQLPDLAKALGYESHIRGISGLFVFLGDLGDFTPTVTSIPLWDYNHFVEAVQAVGIPDRIVGLLDRSNIIRHVRLDDFPHAPFSSD